MERTRPSPPPSEAFEVPPAPAAGPSPRELLDGMRGPGSMTSDVDAFLRALGQPLSGVETPRARADLLLSVLEDTSVRDATGSDGRTVRAAALEALLVLGYPYALEIPPELLSQKSSAHGVSGPPTAGLVLAAFALPAQAVALAPAAFLALQNGHLTARSMLLSAGAGVLPVVLATLGGWQGMRWAQRVGITLMALMGGAFLARFAQVLGQLADGHYQEGWDLFSVLPGALLLTSAWLLRRPWKEETP